MSNQKELRFRIITEKFGVSIPGPDSHVIALAGNPNTGKSTVFNALTGLNQHTGNWPGKTVSTAFGNFTHRGDSFTLVDLPGTYSLFAHSADEQVTRDLICFARPDVTIVVLDATSIERNLNLALQILEITERVVVVVNLMDEAKRKGIHVDIDQLSILLGVPVIPAVARKKKGMESLREAVYDVVHDRISLKPLHVEYDGEVEQKISIIQKELDEILQGMVNSRWVALRLLEGDDSILDSIREYLLPGETEKKLVSREVSPSCH